MLSSCNTGDSRLYFGYGDSRSYFLVLPLKSWVPVYFKLRSAPMENSGIPLQFNCEVVQLAYFCFFLCMHAYVLLVFYVCMPIFFIVRDCQFPSVMLVINILFFFEVVLGLDTDVTWWILNKKLSRALTLWQPDDMHVYWKSKIWCLSVNTKKKKKRTTVIWCFFLNLVILLTLQGGAWPVSNDHQLKGYGFFITWRER